MDIEKLNSLINIDFTNFIPSENNVKYRIVIPFLQSFNHLNLDLEHAAQGSRIDINIGNTIIVETKALGVNIDNHVQQLSDYSGKEIPVLAILTNGRHFRIYSPQWRQKRTFLEKIIYEFELKDLTNIHLLNRLERILDFSNYQSEEFIFHIDQREKELMEVQKEIDEIKKIESGQLTELINEVNELRNQVQEINEQIKAKEKVIANINVNNIPEVEAKIQAHLLPVKKTQISIISIHDLKQSSNQNRTEQEEIERVKKKVPKWFNSPNQANHKILVTYLKLLGQGNSVPMTELQNSCFDIENFQNHYNAMKSIREKNHGKIFEETNKKIFLWEPVKDFIKGEYEKFQR